MTDRFSADHVHVPERRMWLDAVGGLSRTFQVAASLLCRATIDCRRSVRQSASHQQSTICPRDSISNNTGTPPNAAAVDGHTLETACTWTCCFERPCLCNVASLIKKTLLLAPPMANDTNERPSQLALARWPATALNCRDVMPVVILVMKAGVKRACTAVRVQFLLETG